MASVFEESEMTREEAKRILRRLELDAYSSVVTAFRAQGDLNKTKKQVLQDLSTHLSISTERHRAEVRRAVNDDRLNSIAECMRGPATSTEWSIEGRRLVSLMPRLVPQTVFTAKATLTANKTTIENSAILSRKVEVIPAHLKTVTERNYQIVEKEEDNMHPQDLHEQEEDIFNDDEDDTITVSGLDCQNTSQPNVKTKAPSTVKGMEKVIDQKWKANKTLNSGETIKRSLSAPNPVVRIQEPDKHKKKKKLNQGNIKVTTTKAQMVSRPECKTLPSPSKLNITSPPTTPKVTSPVKSPVKFHPKPLILQRSPQKSPANVKSPSTPVESSVTNASSLSANTFNISSSMQFSSFTSTLKLESPTSVSQFTSILQSPKLVSSSQPSSEPSFSMMGSAPGGPLIHKMRFKPPAPRQKAKSTKFKPMGPSTQKTVTGTSSDALNALGSPSGGLLTSVSIARSHPPSITVTASQPGSSSGKLVQVTKASLPASSSNYTSVGNSSKPVVVVSASTTTSKTSGQRVLALGNVPVSGSQQLKIASLPNVLQQSGTLGSGAKIVSLTKSMPMTTGFKMIAVTTVVPGSTQVKTVYIATPIMPVTKGLTPGTQNGNTASLPNARGGNTVVTPSCMAGLIKPTIGSRPLKTLPGTSSNAHPVVTNITTPIRYSGSAVTVTTSSVIMTSKVTSSNVATVDKNVKIVSGKPQITSYKTVGDSWFIAEASSLPSVTSTNTLSSVNSPKVSPVQGSQPLAKNVIVKPSVTANTDTINKNLSKGAVISSTVHKETVASTPVIRPQVISQVSQTCPSSSSVPASSKKRIEEEESILLAGEKFIADLAAKFSRQNSHQGKSAAHIPPNEKAMATHTSRERSNSISGKINLSNSNIDLSASETLDIDEEERPKASHTELITTKSNVVRGDDNRIAALQSVTHTGKQHPTAGVKIVDNCKSTAKTINPNNLTTAMNTVSHKEPHNSKSPPEKTEKASSSPNLTANRIPPSFYQKPPLRPSGDSHNLVSQENKLTNRPSSILGDLYTKEIVKIAECKKGKIPGATNTFPTNLSSPSLLRTDSYNTKSNPKLQSFLDSSPSLPGAMKVRSPESNNTVSFNSFELNRKAELKSVNAHPLAHVALKEPINDCKLLLSQPALPTSNSKPKSTPLSDTTRAQSELKKNPHFSNQIQSMSDGKSPTKMINDTSPAVIVQRIGFDSPHSPTGNLNTNYHTDVISGYHLPGSSNLQLYPKSNIGLSNPLSSTSETDISNTSDPSSSRKRKLGNAQSLGNNVDSSPQRIAQGWVRSALVLLQRVSRFRGPNRQKGEMNAASWFTRPVDPEDAPGYYKIVKRPMDFGTVKKRLENGAYKDYRDFYSDMRLIKSNCYLYNPPGHAARRDCDSVFEFFEAEYRKLLERWEKYHVSPLKKQKLTFSSPDGL